MASVVIKKHVFHALFYVLFSFALNEFINFYFTKITIYNFFTLIKEELSITKNEQK